MGISEKRMKQFAVFGMVALFIVSVYFLDFPIIGRFVGTDDIDPIAENLAKCLTEKEAVMYGLFSCSHCKDQKALFGDAFKFVTYVECSVDQQTCRDKNIRSVPTWEIDGEMTLGVKAFGQLSEMSGCPLE